MYKLRLRLGWVMCLLLTVLVCCPGDCMAQKNKEKARRERKVSIGGSVLNSFTKAGVGAKVTLLTADSVFVDSMTCWSVANNSGYYFEVPAKPAKYILKAEHADYHTAYLNYEINYIARNTSFSVPHLLMKKKDPTTDLDQMLDEVKVVASKVKFLHKGDTLVFNADAFNVPEGSMLDGLIRQLPGVELKKGGEIYVNGRKVDELLLNGERFISSDRELMLDNLPYYVVKDIQVYDRLTDGDKWKGRQTEQKEYVMDVTMKKEFLGGYIGNIDAGVGSHDRWVGRLFAMRNNIHSQLAIVGNLNNVNISSQPGESAEWDPSANTQNEMTQKQIGVNWSETDKDKAWESNFEAVVAWLKDEDENRTASETFASSGNIFNRSLNKSVSDMFNVNAHHWFRHNKVFGSEKLQLLTTIGVDYSRGNSTSMSRSASLNSDPSAYGLDVPQMLDSIFSAAKGTELYGMTTNRSASNSLNRTESLGLNINESFSYKMPWGDIIALDSHGSYSRQSRGDAYSLDRTEFLQNGDADYRNQYQSSPSSNYNFTTSLVYRLNFLNGLTVSPSVSYSQNYSRTDCEYYRLDKLGAGWGSIADSRSLGQLPSTRDSLLLALDMQNSEWHDNMSKTLRGKLDASWLIEHDSINTYLSMNASVQSDRQWMRYDDVNPALVLDFDPSQRLRQSVVTPSFNMNIQRINNKQSRSSYASMSYNFSVSSPSLSQLYTIVKTTDPLMRTYSNPDLKNSKQHSLNLAYSKWGEPSFSVWSHFSIVQDSWGQQRIYNKEKGSYYYKAGNVDGNWNAGVDLTFSCALDSAEHWRFSADTDFGYNHSVDFDMTEIDGDKVVESADFASYGMALSKVNTMTTNSGLYLEYTYADLRINASGNLTWRNSQSHRENFKTINAFEFNYGVDGQYTFPKLALSFSTSIAMFSKRGYQDSDMNTDDLIWNLGVSKSLLKDKALILKLEGVDLFHQLSAKHMTINAQGRTEQWHNCIPNYIMLHAIYRLNILPKKT